MDDFWSSYDDNDDNFFALDHPFWEDSSAGTPTSEINDNYSQSDQKIPAADAVRSDILQLPTCSGSGCLFENIETPENEILPKVVGCRRRKQFTPCKSLPKNDPSFRGARIFMNYVFEDTVPSLVMNLRFQVDNKRRRFRRRFSSRSLATDKLQNQLENADGSFDVTQPVTLPYEKHCASCQVKKTPLWRDAEDGTPLCNACGIRYKKYKIRCARCWHIPKKDESSPNCISCGSGFHFVTHKSY